MNVCCVICVSHYSREILNIRAIKNIDTVYRGEKIRQSLMCYYKGYIPRTIFSSNSPALLTTFSFPNVFGNPREKMPYFSDLTCLVSCVIRVHHVYA